MDSFDYSNIHYCPSILKFINCSREVCGSIDCNYEIYDTSQEEYLFSSTGKTFSLMKTNNFIMKTELVPAFQFFEFLVAASSAAAFWYGFHVVSVSNAVTYQIKRFISMKNVVSQQDENREKVTNYILIRYKQLVKRVSTSTKALSIGISIAKYKMPMFDEYSIGINGQTCKLIRISFIFVICLAGSFYQMYFITESYLSYGIKNEVYAFHPQFIKIPYVHICCLGSEMIKTTPKEYGQIELIGSLTNRTPDYILSQSSDFTNYDTITLRLEDRFEPIVETKYVRQGYICYVINIHPFNSQKNLHRLSTSSLKWDKIDNENSGTVFIVPIDNFASIVTSFRVYLSTSKNLVRGRNIEFASVNRNVKFISSNKSFEYNMFGYNSINFTLSGDLFYFNSDINLAGSYTTDRVRMKLNYFTIKKKLLGSPYVTNCLNYKKIGYTNSGECYENCLSNLTKSFGKMLPFEVSLSKGNYPVVELSDEQYYKYWVKFCENKCKKPDCVSKSYVPSVKNVDPYITVFNGALRYNSTQKTIFLVGISDTPNLIFDTSPDVTLTFLITYNLGCLCFWLNVAPVPLTFKITSLTGEKKKREQLSHNFCHDISNKVQLLVVKLDDKLDKLAQTLVNINLEKNVN